MTGAAGCGVSFSPRAQRRDLLPSRRPGQSPARPNRHRPARLALALAPMAAPGGARRRPLLLLLFGERPGGGRGRGVRRRRGGRGGPAAGPGGAVRPGRAGCGVGGGPGPASGGPLAETWLLSAAVRPLTVGAPAAAEAASGCSRDEDGAGLGPRGAQGGRRPRPRAPVLRALPLAPRATDLRSDAARPPGVLVRL